MNRSGFIAAAWAGMMILIGGVLLASADPKGAATQPAERKFTPVLDIEGLMEGQEIVFATIRDLIKDKKWDDARHLAGVLSELGNVNIHHGEEADYVNHAENMSKASGNLAKALRKREEPEARKAYSEVNAACQACHDQYKDH